jgi:methylated-DNA-[protein]-cysteine S-methyltransferase
MRSVYAIDTPLGTMHAVEEDGSVVRLLLPGEAPPALGGSPQTGLVRELAEYFAGKRKKFDVPVSPEGPEFYRRVWRAALDVPYGKTASYAELARAAGSPNAARAAGRAMAANPVPILIPCHRAVYAKSNAQRYRGGAEMKAFLLGLEERNA